MIILDSVNVILKGKKTEECIIDYLAKYGYDKNYVKKTLISLRTYDYGMLFTCKHYFKTFNEEKKHIRNVYNKIFEKLRIDNKKIKRELINNTVYYKNRYAEKDTYVYLKKLKEIDNLILCSNAHPSMKISLKRLKLKKYFKYIYISGEHQINKPDLKVYKFLLKKYKCKPQECYYLDDMLENVISASSIGINSYLMLKKNNDAQKKDLENYSGSVNIVESLEEFYEIVKKKS